MDMTDIKPSSLFLLRGECGEYLGIGSGRIFSPPFFNSASRCWWYYYSSSSFFGMRDEQGANFEKQVKDAVSFFLFFSGWAVSGGL